MIKKLTAAASICLATATVVTGMLGCQAGEPAPFDPRGMGQGERLASKDARTYEMPPLPTTTRSIEDMKQPPPTTGPSLGTEPQVRLTLQEIIHRAVANSADIKVQSYQPAIDQTRVIEAEARFDPSFFSSLQVQRQMRDNLFNVSGAEGNLLNQTDVILSAGLRQQLESGGSIEFRNSTTITYNSTLDPAGDTTTGPNDSGTNPAIQNETVLQITQPLLRDFGNEINRARITINRNNQTISLLDFRKQVEDTIAEIERTYWDLVEAERVVKIQEELVSQTVVTGKNLIERTGAGGDVSQLQLSQTDAQLQSRLSTLIRAKTQLKNLSDQLKRSMNDPEFAVTGPIIILPASPPLQEQVKFDPKEVTDTALENRLELGQQKLRVDSATTALAVGKNNLLPQLNAAGSINFQGLSGNPLDVVEEQFQRDYVSWSFGLEFEIPIGNRAARATYQRALMQRAQAIESYHAAMGTVNLECVVAIREVNSAWNTLLTDRTGVFSAANALQILDKRFELENRTPELLQLRLQFQDTLAQTRRDEAASLSRYNQAIARLEQVKGTLLQYVNVIMKEDMIPYERKWVRK